MSKNTYCDIEERYKKQTNDEPILIDVSIGNAQIGSYSIFHNKELLGTNKEVELSRSGELNGKIFVSAVARDIRKQTNWVSVTVHIKEGNINKEFGPYSKEVENDLDTVTYSIIIDLT